LMAAYLVRESLLDERARVDSRAAQGSPGGGSESTLHDVMCEVEEEGWVLAKKSNQLRSSFK
jgi:hypothetical protein